MKKRSGWDLDLDRCVPVKDGYERSKLDYENCIRKLDQELIRVKLEEKTKEKEREQKKRKESVDRVLATMRVKYLPKHLDADNDAVLEEVLRQDKYLLLAHSLKMNREDWSDGYGLAEGGLSEFKIENEVDRKIEKCIQSCINQFEDGRVFRDCEWNYNAIYGLVKEDLIHDYTELLKALLFLRD